MKKAGVGMEDGERIAAAAGGGGGGGNLFSDLPSGQHPGTAEGEAAGAEIIQALLTAPGLTIERIVSTGQASLPGHWYDQAWAEWVLVLSGEAGLLLEGEAAPRHLIAGDYLEIPPHRRHRIVWTAAGRPTLWLAVHHGAVPQEGSAGPPDVL